MPYQFIHSNTKQQLSIITCEPDEGMMATIARLVGRDMDDLSSEMFDQRWLTLDEYLSDTDVEFFHHEYKMYQKTPNGLRCWWMPKTDEILH